MRIKDKIKSLDRSMRLCNIGIGLSIGLITVGILTALGLLTQKMILGSVIPLLVGIVVVTLLGKREERKRVGLK